MPFFIFCSKKPEINQKIMLDPDAASCNIKSRLR